MNQTFEKMVQEATVAWTMIHHLDNNDNVGPKSQEAQWAKEKGRKVGVNENHARGTGAPHCFTSMWLYSRRCDQMAYVMRDGDLTGEKKIRNWRCSF